MKQFELWIETEQGDPADKANRPTENFCNIRFSLNDGRSYALNVWTYDFVQFAKYEWPYDTEVSDRTELYVLPPDLFVERLDRATLENVVSKLIEKNDLQDRWMCAGEAP